MSKKGLKTILVCIVLLIGLVTLFACNKGNVADKDGQTKVIVKIQDEDGSSYKENVVFSDLFTLSLQKEGYTGRLYRDADFLKPLTKDSKVKNGDTVYVKWTINKYTVTFMDGETVLKTFPNVKHGSAVTPPEVSEKDGKTFKGWDNKAYNNVTSDLTINAVYDVDTFTVTFKDGEKVLETQTVEYEAAATAPDIARLSPPEGMHFAKWDKDFSKVTEDIEVSAVYELNVYTVIFKNGETTLKTEKVKHGFAATAPNVVDTATKKFVGWDNSFDNVTSDLIVNAKFETKKFTLTFINFDGTTVYTEEVEYGASIDSHFETADNAATYDDTILDYDGWYKADGTRIDELDLPTMPAENFTLTLKLSLMDSAIGEFKVNTPADFTFTESSTAEFSVMPNEGTTLHAGVTYKYIWTINKDNVFYKTEKTTESSLTLQNLAAGEYLANVKIVASMENCDSVEKEFAGETLIVSRAEISGITVTGGTFTYGDENAKIKIDGLKDGDKVFYGTDGVSFSSEIVDFSKCDVGEYTYYVKVERNENYNAKTLDVTINIVKAAVTITFTPDKNDEVVYGDELPSLSAYVGETKIGTVAKEDYALKLNEISFSGIATYVGECSIEVKNFTNDYYNTNNFNITFSSYKITVKKATLNVNIAEISNLTYGDDLPEIGYEIKGWKNGDDKSEYKLLPETKYAKKSAVGTYSFTYNVSGEKIGYYDVTVNTVEFTVKQRAATITINKVNNIIYGDKVPDLSAKVEVKGVLDGDKLSYELETNYTVGAKPGGDYTASVVFDKTAEANKNYEITAIGTTFKVGKKGLTITLGSKRVVTGKEYKVDVGKLEIVGLVEGDTVTGYVTITKDEAGVYTANDFDKSNLKFDSECYEVIKYDLTVEFVKVDFKIHFEDHEVVYDGQNHNVSVTAEEGTKYTITYGTKEGVYDLTDAPEYKNAGVYVTYFKVVDTSVGDAEYEGFVSLTIKQKEVVLTVKTYTITYGDTLPEFSYDVTGLIGGDVLSGEARYSVDGITGGNVGTYKINVDGLSANDNYAITVVPGTLTINQKSIAVVWSTKDKYVYSPDGQEMPAATYDGKSAKVTTNGEFKNAGTYTFTATDESGNYTLTNAVLNVVIAKATYSGIVHDPLSGVYNPAKTLKDYALAEGFTWVDASEKPVCTKPEYAAIYNADSDNYENFELNIAIDLQKAKVALKDGVVGFDYDGTSHEVKAAVTYNGVALDTSLYSLTYDGKTSKTYTDAGTHACLIEISADNYALPENTYLYVKVKGVKVGNNYYTIEDALDVATSGQTIFVLNDTAFATQEIAGVLYNDVKFKTVKTGVTLLLPFNENDTVGHIGAGKEGSDNYKATAALTGTAKLYKTLVIPEGIEVIVNGNLIVGAQTGKIDAGQRQNAVSGNYCEITLGGTITLNNATLEVYGYIKGNGEIIANNSTVIENLYLSGWMGGKISAIRYIGNDKILAGTLMIEGELKIDKPTQFPFSQYELRSIEAKLVVNKGSKLQGYAKIATGAIATVRAQINEAWLTFVSSDANNVDSGLFRLVGNNSKIIKSMNGDRIKIDLFGEIKDGYTSISILVINRTVSMTSEKVFFPIDGRTDITLKNGATFTQSYMFKALPGATITVENGGTYNLNGQLIMYDKSFTDISTYPYPGASRGDAKLTVNGTMNVNGALGGNVTSDNAGTVAVEANATISGIHSAEGEGTMEVGLSVKFTFNDTCGVTKSLVFVNSDNSTVAAVTNKTYNYNNGTWQ